MSSNPTPAESPAAPRGPSELVATAITICVPILYFALMMVLNAKVPS